MKLEEYLDKVGSFGFYHKRIYVLMCISVIPNTLITLHFLFSHFEPDFRCRFSEYSEVLLKNFGLVCDMAWKAPLAVSIFQVGKFLGGIGTSIGDRFGRRKTFILTSMIQILAIALAAIGRNYVIYVNAMCWIGFSITANYALGFVIATETTGIKKRNFVAAGSFFATTLAYITTPLIAYYLQDWRQHLWTVTGITIALYIPCFCLIPESARWLLEKGRNKEAIKELRKIAKLNGTKVDYEQILKDNNIEVDSKLSEQKKSGLIEACRLLVISSIRWRCFSCFFGWFVTCLVYYAISLHSTSFSENRFLNCLYAGIAEIPAYISAFFAVKYIGRPRTFAFCMFLCGLSCFILPFLPKHSVLTTMIAMLSKAGVTASFFVIYTISSETSPTLQRTSLLGLGSGLGRIGAILASFLMYMEKTLPSLPNLIMGAMAILCGIITLIFIPETKGIPMPDSANEALSNKRIYGWNVFRNLAPKIDETTHEMSEEEKKFVSTRETEKTDKTTC